MLKSDLVMRLVALMPLASKDPTRNRLCGVAVSRCDVPGSVLLEVTNGHYMAREYVAAPEVVEQLSEGKKYFFRTSALDWLKNASMLRIENGMWLDLDGAGIKLEECAGYPNLEQLEPKRSEMTHVIGLDAQYLIEIVKALKERRSTGVALRVKFEGNAVTGPMVVSVGERTATLMPMRV